MSKLSLEDAMNLVGEAIITVAPEVADEIDGLDRTVDLWDFLDLDSMDHLNVMTEIARRSGVEIAERDYGDLRSLGSLAEHLSANAA